MLRGLALGLLTGLAVFGAEELTNFALAQPALLTAEVLQLLPLYMAVPGLVGALVGALGAHPSLLAWWIWTGTASFLLGGRLSFQLAERTLPGALGFATALLVCGGAMAAVVLLTRSRHALRWGALGGAWTVTVLVLVANLNALGSAFSRQALGVDAAILVLGGVVSLLGARFFRDGLSHPVRFTAQVALVCWVIRLPLPALLAEEYPVPRSPSPDQPPVLLVVVDTFRADRLGATGYARDLTPNLDALASRSTVYTQAMAGAGWTLPAFATILTGLEPDHHGAGVNDGERNLQTGLAAGTDTLPRALQEAGYTTGGIVTNAWLKSLFGLDQGFDYYDDALGLGHMPLILQPLDELGLILLPDRSYTPADRQADKALSYIRSQGSSPWFLMLHFMDPHGPYNPPDRHLAALPADYEDPTERLYDAEIRFMDEQLGRVLEALPQDAWVVVTADHGEEFGEHPGAYADQPIPPGTRHGHSVYEELVRVPLMVSSPHGQAGQQVERDVRTSDILPTLLRLTGQDLLEGLDGDVLQEALGQPADEAICAVAVPAVDCVPTLAQSCTDPCSPALREVYAALELPAGVPVLARPSIAAAVRYGAERKALRLWPWKLIHGPDRDELYNLASDPTEAVDLLASGETSAQDQLSPKDRAAHLSALLQSSVKGTAPLVAPEIDPKTEQQLRDLGYIE